MVLMRTVIDSALSEVYGHAQTMDATTYLHAPIGTTDTSISVSDASRFSRGMVQIGDELILVDEVDRTANKLTLLYAQGRGIRGTAPEAHAVGELVTMAPSIPRNVAVKSVEQTLATVFGLFQVKQPEFNLIATQTAYPVAAGTDDILDVSWFPPGPSKEWLPVRHWTFDRHNMLLVIHDMILPGRTVRYTAKSHPSMVAQDKDFSETGLPDSCIDVIRYGAAWRMCSFIEPYNLLATKAESDAMGRGKTPGSRLAVSKYYYQMYQQRLQEEVISLQGNYPIRAHYVAQW